MLHAIPFFATDTKHINSPKFCLTGSVDSIRVWNVKTGQATCRLSVSKRGEEVIVWCLAFLSDNTIVSGDSLGRLSFWDITIGDQVTYQYYYSTN